jgi:hypothetical protein
MYMFTPIIGQPWPEQGGVYLGQRLIDGVPHHIIVAPGIEHDIKHVEFGNIEAEIERVGTLNGHSDWVAPDQEDLMLAYVYVPELFVRECGGGIYWSRHENQYGWPWAVDFTDGCVLAVFQQYRESRVRPFRHIPVLTKEQQ